MNSKPTLIAALAALPLLAPAPSPAAPLVSVGDSVDIFFNGTASALWHSNIFRDEDDEKSDMVFILSPGFEINFGRGVSNADLTLFTSYDIIRYDDNNDLDTETFNIDLAGAYRASRLELNGTAFYDEEQTSTGNVSLNDNIIEWTDLGGSLFGEYTLSPKLSVKSGVNYVERSYESPFDENFSDYDSFRIPVDVFYEMTPKFDLSLGYEYSKRDVKDRDGFIIVSPVNFGGGTFDGYDYETHFFNVGVRGEILPKLSGHFKAGYRERDSYTTSKTITTPLLGPAGTVSRDVDSDGSLGLDADLTWRTTPKLTTNIGLSRDFGVGGEGDATENTRIDLDFAYVINANFSAAGLLSYEMRDYEGGFGREDDELEAGASLSYRPNSNWQFSAGYRYSENDSDIDEYGFENHMLSLSANLRY
jgi:hypothetical protein